MERLRREPCAAAAETRLAAELKETVDIPMLLRLRDQMKQQLMECSAAVNTVFAGHENYLNHIAEEKVFRSATKDLEKNMEEVKVSFENKTLALQRMQLTDALRKKVNQNDDDSQLIVETMRKIVMLTKTVIEHQQQAREKEQKLIDIKRKRLLLKKAERQKLLQIQTMLKKQKEKKANMKVHEILEKVHNNLQKEQEVTTVIQNVFQNIIIASRVNWAEDPSLKAIVLQLEKNVRFL